MASGLQLQGPSALPGLPIYITGSAPLSQLCGLDISALSCESSQTGMGSQICFLA